MRFTQNISPKAVKRLALGVFTVVSLVFAGIALWPAPPAPVIISKPIEDPRLSPEDAAIYARALQLVKEARFDEAHQAMLAAENQMLMGHVLGETYLHEKSRPSTGELTAWLENYGDHPQALRIAALAKRKGADVDPDMYRIEGLKHAGLIEHLGRKTLPNSWYQGLGAWRKRDYGTAAAKFTATGSDEKANRWHRAAGFYWAFRSYARLNDMARAQVMLSQASLFPDTFYGVLASTRLNITSPIMAAAPYLPRSIVSHPAALRARGLAASGALNLAEDELRHLYGVTAQEEHPAILSLAAELGLANLQIRLRKLDGLSEHEKFFASYPVPAHVVAASGATNPALVLAVALQESAFRDTAKSEVGARGMMQVMPTTAEAVLGSSSFKLAYANEDLSALGKAHPDMNVRIGATYLALLQKKPAIGDSLIHVLAAYNAGPGSVSSWQKAAKSIRDPLLYIESIPYPETRNYVLQVLTHYFMYQQILGQQPRAIISLAQGQWPQAASAN